MARVFKLCRFFSLLMALALAATLKANVAGGGTGTGANVTLVDNGTTVTLGNGIVSFLINKTSAQVTQFNFSGSNLLSGGHNGGVFYHDWTMADGNEGPNGTLSVITNPTSNGGNYGEVMVHSPWSGNAAVNVAMDVDIYYSLPRGAQGLYTTAVITHPASYPDNTGGEWRSNVYVGSAFDWLCVDPYRFKQMASPNDTSVAVAGAPKEVFQFTSGIYNGLTECKYAYSAALGSLDCYGWASSTTPLGIWQVIPSHEYYSGGPMKRELTEHLGNTLLNMFGGQHYGMGGQFDMAAGTLFTKTYGPYFLYFNKYAGAATDPVATKAQALWADAKAQAAAEKAAWPYTWFAHPAIYDQASARGSVSGTFAIKDAYNAAASPAGMWIGLAPQDGGNDFQLQARTYQFWVKTAADGSFIIPNVIPGAYNLWAFGPGAAGTFEQAGLTVLAGQALSLGTVTWTPPRLGPTVWEIGIPDRDSKEFNNGDRTPGVLPGYAVWGAFIDYPTQYPNGVSYTVGASNYATDWDYCQPTVLNADGVTYSGSTSKVFFNLAQAPVAGDKARLYTAFATAYGAAVIETVNGALITSSTGFYPTCSGDAMIRLGSQGDWGDTATDFAVSLLHKGMNEIDITLRAAGGASNSNDVEYDYVRLEMQGFVSATPTPSATVAPGTPTSSPTRTPTASASPTSSATRSATPSSSATAGQASPTSTLTATLSKAGTVTTTASPSATPSFSSSATVPPLSSATASPTASNTEQPTASPSPSATAEPSGTASATPTLDLVDSPTDTATPSPTSTTSPTAAASPTNSSTTSPSATASFTPTPTASAEAMGSPLPTATAEPSGTASASPSAPAPGQGRPVIDRIVPVPNPNPRMLDLRLLGALSQVQVKVWTVALVLVGQSQAGPLQAGWQQVPLPSLAALPSGAYFISVSGQQGSTSAKAPPAARMLVLH